MPEGSLITDKLKNLAGLPWPPQVFKVEEGAIKRYAGAIDDSNPLYSGVDYARKSPRRRLMCSPGFTGWLEKKSRLLGIQVSEVLIELGATPRPLGGGIEIESLLTVSAGDTLTETTRIIDITERETRILANQGMNKNWRWR